MTVAVVALVTVIVALLYTLRDERQQHRDEIAALLERIRSPELHKPEPKIPDDIEDIPAVEFDNDEAFWEVKNGRS